MSGRSKGNKTEKNAWKKPPNLSEQKFREAQAKMQETIQKHVQNYESSSEEEEIESSGVIDTISKNYVRTGGKDLGRTKAFLEESLLSGAATCLICIATIKRLDSVWSCLECFCLFHLECIQRWSKDSIVHQKRVHEDQNPNILREKYNWGCPKCRHEYEPSTIPNHYLCFCTKAINPPYHPWLPPHSCGEVCEKNLVPLCGHKCLLLCHPGPCPPCPKTINALCFCGNERRTTRCSGKLWACSSKCNKLLSCGRHKCAQTCHGGDCASCPKQSRQPCDCGGETVLRECSTPKWKCNKVCGKRLKCGNHTCEIVCHTGDCGPCPLTEIRFCPCEKQFYQLPCTEETPTCGNTCDKMLECGVHTCLERCHRNKCGNCLEMVVKKCRCGLHSKELSCPKEYLCDTKCKQMKDCQKHPCNRKCCDGNCPPCEKPCGRSLKCGMHKCPSTCHRGPCYPCPRSAVIKCHCGGTTITVPCGRQKATRPPRCSKLCRNPPDCHHAKRENHRCHFGECAPCALVCNKDRANCVHLCPAVCHSSVLVKVEETQKPSMPWEKKAPTIKRQSLPCPDCVVPMSVTCLGGHETGDWPCHIAKPRSCGRLCGRELSCGNHTCQLPCHDVQASGDNINMGVNCRHCDSECTKPQLEGCVHPCPKMCHPGKCAPCNQLLRVKCHCGLNQVYLNCSDFTNETKRDKLTTCGNRCPKQYQCGHRCAADCHSGDCPDEKKCQKKVKLSCKCKRIKKDFHCDVVRSGDANVQCNDECKRKLEQVNAEREVQNLIKQQQEEAKNQRELEEFEKKFKSKKRYRERKYETESEEQSLFRRFWYLGPTLLVVILGLYIVSHNISL